MGTDAPLISHILLLHYRQALRGAYRDPLVIMILAGYATCLRFSQRAWEHLVVLSSCLPT
jgi:hypothetical protein